MTDRAAHLFDEPDPAPAQAPRVEELAANPGHSLCCPACDQTMEVTLEEVARMMVCPACGSEFIVPAIDGTMEIIDEAEAYRRAHAKTQEQELNGFRMRQIVANKRGAIRSQTYCIVGACLGALGAAKLVQMTIYYVKPLGWRAQPVGYVLFAAALLVGSLWCLRRAAYWNAESKLNPFAGRCAKCGHDLADSPEECAECGEPVEANTANPDFSGLSDGSHFARDLEEMK